MDPQVEQIFRLREILWPHVCFYDKQREIIASVIRNKETIVPAGNMLGKDFVAGFLVVAFILTRAPVRVVTTSAKELHLDVLWSEIGQRIADSKIPLEADKGGPLIARKRKIQIIANGQVCPMSYVVGMVASEDKQAALQGHHIARLGDGVPRTLFMCDEASSVPDFYIAMIRTWAERQLIFGNTWQCENYFKYAVKGNPATGDPGGDMESDVPGIYYRKVIRIRAEDSPNVRLGLLQKAQGLTPTNEMLIPGVKPYEDYVWERKTWDPIQQCVSLDADWYEGAEVLLFPPVWLNHSEQLAAALQGKQRQAEAIGVDPAEGGDRTAMAAVDRFGLIELTSRKTPNTDDVPKEIKAFAKKHNVPAKRITLDRGGGGKEHADRLRAEGWDVQTVFFGSDRSVLQRGKKPFAQRLDEREELYAYKDKRSELYGRLSIRIDPHGDHGGFAIPGQYDRLRHQLSVIPKDYDSEGRLALRPKKASSENDKRKTLVDLIGYSPDEADALALGVYTMERKKTRIKAGALWV